MIQIEEQIHPTASSSETGNYLDTTLTSISSRRDITRTAPTATTHYRKPTPAPPPTRSTLRHHQGRRCRRRPTYQLPSPPPSHHNNHRHWPCLPPAGPSPLYGNGPQRHRIVALCSQRPLRNDELARDTQGTGRPHSLAGCRGIVVARHAQEVLLRRHQTPQGLGGNH